MKLIIKEYLTLLKESTELDKLLPDLLLSMSIPPISHPQKGVRQAGVDVAAVGEHPETKIKTLFLFLIKQGDMGRNDWNVGQQAVRPSLDEIIDVYIPNNIPANLKNLPIKIIVCTGGILKQDCQQDWSGYTSKEERKGTIEYEFWGGDELATYIEKYLLNAHLLPELLQSKFRRTLVLLDDPDYDCADFYNLLDDLLSPIQNNKKLILKNFRTINLCLHIIFYWSKNNNNLRPVIYCAERAILNAWDKIKKYNLKKNPKITASYQAMLETLLSVYCSYIEKIQKSCQTSNGLSGYSHDYILECLTIHENLGFLGIAGHLLLSTAIIEQSETHIKHTHAIVIILKDFISNHKSTRSPCYDSHIIEISTAIHLLAIFKQKDFIKEWINNIIDSVSFTYFQMNKYFPIQTENFDLLIDLNISQNIKKEKLFETSSLLAILAQWCAVLEFDDIYEAIQKFVEKNFPNCTLQIWYPDHDTEMFLYNSNAGKKSGNAEAPIKLPKTAKEMLERINQVQDRVEPMDRMSFYPYGLTFLPLISSRHFRTPILPTYWQKMALTPSTNA